MEILVTIVSYISIAITFITGFLGIPQGELDLSEFTLVWEDEFEGDTLNTDNWIVEDCVRKGGYWSDEMVWVEDGNLIISTQYVEDGDFGTGYYTGAVSSVKTDFTHGYYEVRCILPDSEGIWSAFWMMPTDGFGMDGTGTSGAEIDIFEAPYSYMPVSFLKNRVQQAIHFDGYGDEHQTISVSMCPVSGDPYSEYNTYGLEWNEDEYIFYINGVQVSSTSFGGAALVEEYLILSVEIGGTDGVPEYSWAGGALDDEDVNEEFIIDYVRVYAYN